MKVFTDYSIKSLNTFSIDSVCPTLYELEHIDDLYQLSEYSLHHSCYLLGQGSNTLFVDTKTPVMVRPNFKGISITEDKHSYYLDIAAGENWHELVKYTISQGMYGLENLALIPGTVGAAPVQNIGAYGVEFADFCVSVSWFSFSEQKIIELSASACQFDYRDSIFKHLYKDQGIIVSVKLALKKQWQAKLNYAGLNELAVNSDAMTVMNKVIEIRQSKLPDPSIIANAGSFFKNPVVSTAFFNSLLVKYPSMPYYLLANDTVKLAAGWLIEQTGLKGYRHEHCSVHDKQALVLVNHGSATGRDIICLAKDVVEQVANMFSIKLIPEVRLVTKTGEVDFESIVNDV